MSKLPPIDALRLAAEWLDEFEADPTNASSVIDRDQCREVAAYLRALADKREADLQLRETLRGAGLQTNAKTVAILRRAIKKGHS